MTPEIKSQGDAIVEKFRRELDSYSMSKKHKLEYATRIAIRHCEMFSRFLANYPTPRDITIQMELDKYTSILSYLNNKK